MANKILLTPELLKDQSREMTSLMRDYEELFSGVTTTLNNTNSHWSENLANNFSGKIMVAQKSFSGIVSMLGAGAAAAMTSATTMGSVDNALKKIAEGVFDISKKPWAADGYKAGGGGRSSGGGGKNAPGGGGNGGAGGRGKAKKSRVDDVVDKAKSASKEIKNVEAPKATKAFKQRKNLDGLYESNYYHIAANYLGVPMPNCTTYAWARSLEIMEGNPKFADYVSGRKVPPFIVGGHSNASQWWENNLNSANPLPTGQIPKRGAIAVWTDGGFGHVAVVEDIANNGTVYCSQSNYGGAAFEYVTQEYAGRGQRLLGYIYLE